MDVSYTYMLLHIGYQYYVVRLKVLLKFLKVIVFYHECVLV